MQLIGRIHNYKRGSRISIFNTLLLMAADVQSSGDATASLYVPNEFVASLTLANTTVGDLLSPVVMQTNATLALTLSPPLLIRADFVAALSLDVDVEVELDGGTPAPPLETHGNFKRFSARSGPAVKAATPRRDVSEISTGEIVVQDKPSYDDLLGHNLYIKKRA